jgi:uncharacterized protein DUF4238
VQSPKKIHLVTRGYLESWTSGGLLRPVSVRYGPQKLKAPAGVGWRKEWWGAGDDVLNRVCEENCGKLETVLPETLATVEPEWPLDLDDRAVLAQFLALHVLRTAAFTDWFTPTRDSSIAEYRDHFPNRRSYERFRLQMRSDRERSVKLLSLINKLSSVFASMHWTLLSFDEPLLVTGDQPVCPVPILTPGVESPVAASPRDGWMDTSEIRCALTPQLALLMSWHLGPTVAPVAGTWAHAVNLNTAVIGQAVEQYFQTPTRLPALAPAIFREPQRLLGPISLDVLPGYSVAEADVSPLRARTRKALEALIEDRDHETISVVHSELPAASGDPGANTATGRSLAAGALQEVGAASDGPSEGGS